MERQVTYWLTPDDDIEISREDKHVRVTVISGETVEFFIPPALFPQIRTAMSAAERHPG
jgi:hypothetical protein